MLSNSCRICDGDLKIIINYGKHALAGSFLKTKKEFKKEKKYPLNLCFCKFCSHIQIKDIIEPKKLFENYLWETGVSKTNLNIIDGLIKKLIKLKKINKKTRILEIASNDGTFLQVMQKKFGSYVLGVDPAKNFKKLYKKKKIKFFCDFFKKNISKKILKNENKFDLIIARNVIAHTNPNEIFSEAKKLLNNNGIFLLEFPSLLSIYRGLQYDNVFHEHVGYHSLKSVIDLANRNELNLFDLSTIESQGISLRCFFRKENNFRENKKIKYYLSQEKKNKLYNINTWFKFASKVKQHSRILKVFLKNLKKKNKKISVYGASGKGQSLLQFNKIDKSLIDYVFDKSRLKIDKFTPGSNIRILSPSKIDKSKVDFILLMNWNLKKEILLENKKFVKSGGKFIIPFPKIKIL